MNSEFRNWSDVRVFLAVVRAGSTLAASRALGMSQPTVARRIDVLENATGLTLFDRDTRGFRPTKDAHTLIPLAEVIEQSVRQFADTSRDLARPRPIRVTSAGAFSDKSLDIFSAFSALHPGVAFTFLPSMRLLNLRAGEADIAIRLGDAPSDDALICRTLGTEHWSLFAGRAYAEKFGLPQSVDDLNGHHFVTFQGDDVPGRNHRWLAQRVTPDQIVLSFSDFDLTLAAIRAGHGLGLVFGRFADDDKTLIRCFHDIPELDRPVRMLISPDAYRRPEVKAFAAFFGPRYGAMFKPSQREP